MLLFSNYFVSWNGRDFYTLLTFWICVYAYFKNGDIKDYSFFHKQKLSTYERDLEREKQVNEQLRAQLVSL